MTVSVQSKLRVVATAIACTMLIASTVMWAQGEDPPDPHQICGNEPAWDHYCREGGTCRTHRVCTGTSFGLGDRTTFCCYEYIDGLGVRRCVEVRGGWECCDTSPSPSWRAICYLARKRIGVCQDNICPYP